MAISRKPKSQRDERPVNVEALINKGGSVARHEEVANENDTTTVILRIPGRILQRVDASVSARPIKTPRNTWILEALLEKLEKESV